MSITSSLDRPPKHFTCPITEFVMSDPVTLVGDGKTYDRESLNTWFMSGSLHSPVTGNPLSSREVHDDVDLKEEIVQFLRSNPQFSTLANPKPPAGFSERVPTLRDVINRLELQALSRGGMPASSHDAGEDESF